VRLVLHRHGPIGAGPDGAQWSLYGLAEAGVVLAARRLDGPSRDAAVIGRPVDGVRLAVLDEYGAPVPPGASGELVAGGSCVPLAVTGDAPANAGRLLPDPFGPPGSRMLGAVARARWLADGTLRVLDAPAVPPVPATGGQATDDRPLTPGELVVAEAWSALIGVRPGRAGDDFYALGGYSLLVPALAGRLRSAAGADVPLAALFGASTLGAQAALLDRGAQSSPDTAATGEAELVAGATLDPAIVVHARAPVPAWPPRRILLTGATGFLGSFLLAELLRTWPDSTVICLVRATDRDQAERRVHEAAGHYRQWSDAHRHRVTAVAGDLALPRLGLSQDRFDALAGSLDLVLHNGARINLVEPFHQLYGANVAGTQEILRLAAPRAVPVHLVSSTAVLAGSGTAPPLLGEADRLGAAQVGPYGYVRSKWAAEELVRAAAGRGLPVTVYRPGRISGDTVNGICGRDDAFWTVLRGSMEAGAVPDGPGWQTATADLVPVDYVARAIIHLCAHHNAEGRTYHLVNPVPTRLSSVLDRARAAGVALQDVPPQDWARRLAATARRGGTGSAALPAATLVGDMPDQERILPARRYDASGTRAALAGSGIDCPVVGPELLDRYLRLLLPTGAQPAPAGSPR
jgi:thioester reductase-like protein